MKVKGIVRVSLIVVIAVIALIGSIYTVQEQEQAVVTTFGNASLVSSPGIHLRAPFVSSLEKVSTAINGFSLGYDIQTREPIESESLMITADYNFVNVDFYIEYRVVEPIRYVYGSESPLSILKTLAQSYIRDTVGLYSVDDVITTGKNVIQAEIKEKLGNRLVEENIGLQLVNVTIQDSTPPTQEVLQAFKSVETAKQGKDTALNKAQQYKNEKLPAAEAQVDQITQNAEAQKQARINEAQGQVSRFNALYAQYKLNPLITRQRMFYEAMEEVLPSVKIYVTNGGDVQTLLPLESFIGNAGAATPAPAGSEAATAGSQAGASSSPNDASKEEK